MNDVQKLLLCIPISFLLVDGIWAFAAIPNSWWWGLLWEKDLKNIPNALARAFVRRNMFNTHRATVFYRGDNDVLIGVAVLVLADTENVFQSQHLVIKDVCKFMGVAGKPRWKITVVYPGNYKVISIYNTRIEAVYKTFVRISAYIDMYKMMLEYPEGQLVPILSNEGK